MIDGLLAIAAFAALVLSCGWIFSAALSIAAFVPLLDGGYVSFIGWLDVKSDGMAMLDGVVVYIWRKVFYSLLYNQIGSVR